jgi:hypothetical protein
MYCFVLLALLVPIALSAQFSDAVRLAPNCTTTVFANRPWFSNNLFTHADAVWFVCDAQDNSHQLKKSYGTTQSTITVQGLPVNETWFPMLSPFKENNITFSRYNTPRTYYIASSNGDIVNYTLSYNSSVSTMTTLVDVYPTKSGRILFRLTDRKPGSYQCNESLIIQNLDGTFSRISQLDRYISYSPDAFGHYDDIFITNIGGKTIYMINMTGTDAVTVQVISVLPSQCVVQHFMYLGFVEDYVYFSLRCTVRTSFTDRLFFYRKGQPSYTLEYVMDVFGFVYAAPSSLSKNRVSTNFFVCDNGTDCVNLARPGTRMSHMSTLNVPELDTLFLFAYDDRYVGWVFAVNATNNITWSAPLGIQSTGYFSVYNIRYHASSGSLVFSTKLYSTVNSTVRIEKNALYAFDIATRNITELRVLCTTTLSQVCALWYEIAVLGDQVYFTSGEQLDGSVQVTTYRNETTPTSTPTPTPTITPIPTTTTPTSTQIPTQTPSPTPTSTPQPDDKHIGIIIGSVIGGIVGLIAIGVIITVVIKCLQIRNARRYDALL